MNSLPTSPTSSTDSTDHHGGPVQHHGSVSHMWLMLACCLVPIGLFAAVAAFGIPFSGVFSFAIFLLCPVMMFFMMRGQGHGSGTAGSDDSHSSH